MTYAGYSHGATLLELEQCRVDTLRKGSFTYHDRVPTNEDGMAALLADANGRLRSMGLRAVGEAVFAPDSSPLPREGTMRMIVTVQVEDAR